MEGQFESRDFGAEDLNVVLLFWGLADEFSGEDEAGHQLRDDAFDNPRGQCLAIR